MEEFELYKKVDTDFKPTTVWCCVKCRVVHRDESAAAQCCKPWKCKTCNIAEVPPYHSICDSCDKIQDAKREVDLFEKAEKIPEEQYDGWVFSDRTNSNDGFACEIEELLQGMVDDWDGSPEDKPECPKYVWATTVQHISPMDAADIAENATSDMHEDAYDSVEGKEELQKALDAFEQVNKNLISYIVDYKRVVILKPRFLFEHEESAEFRELPEAAPDK